MSLHPTDEQCASDFISSRELKEQAQFIPNFAEVYGEFMVFPHMNLSQDGQLVKWIFTAVDQGPGGGRTQYPDLQVYRGGSRFVTLSGSESAPTGYPNVYEYTPDSPLPVEAGDFIAIEQPPEDSARLLLSFVWYAGPPGLTFDDRRKRQVQPFPGREGNLPLVTLEIGKFKLRKKLKNMRIKWPPILHRASSNSQTSKQLSPHSTHCW